MSWASLASSSKSATIDASKPVRVVARTGPAPAAPVAPKEKESPAKPEAAAKRPARRPEPVGDRLMFNTTAPVTDEDIRAALGAMATSLVSLRNCSDKGRVFMDFAANVQAFDDLSSQEILLGESKTKISVYRQHDRR